MNRMGTRNRPWRRATAALALVLFIAGTNYCLVGGIASRFGVRVSCMAPVAAASGSCHDLTSAGHCGHLAGSPQGASGPFRHRPVRPATPPCCVALAPVLATAPVKVLVGPMTAVLPTSSAAAEAIPVLASWRGHRISRDTGPPALHTRAPLSERAPPLA
jgi:hypothetical protein